MVPLLLAQTRPQPVSEAVERAAVAVSRRQGEWGVDGEWSYDFSKLGYACAATSHSGAMPKLDDNGHLHPQDGNSSNRFDVLKDSFDRVTRSRGGGAAFRVLDLGSGSGGWLLQARRELDENTRKSPAMHLHGVTGDALPLQVQAMKPSKVKKKDSVEVALFQQVGIETFPLRLGGDTHCCSEAQRVHFARTVETAFVGEGLAGERYDLIVSSWTFCHLIDPLATLELWSNALAVEGELYVNDIDFSVLFDTESTLVTSLHTHKENAGEDSTGVARARDQHSESGDARSADHDHRAFWESDPEKRMERVFEVVNRKGRKDHAFSIEFAYDEENYRTAVKVRRISAAPIRFAPWVGYSCLGDRDDKRTCCLDSGGRPVYRIYDNLSELDSTVAG